jgi:hypothetical protein
MSGLEAMSAPNGYGLSSREQRELQSVMGEHLLLALDR